MRWIAFICALIIALPVLAQETNTHTFGDGTTITFPASWEIDFAEEDYLALFSEDTSFYFNIAYVDSLLMYDLTGDLGSVLAEAYNPFNSELPFEIDNVELLTIDGVSLARYAYMDSFNDADSEGMLIAAQSSTGAVLTVDVVPVGETIMDAEAILEVMASIEALGATFTFEDGVTFTMPEGWTMYVEPELVEFESEHILASIEPIDIVDVEGILMELLPDHSFTSDDMELVSENCGVLKRYDYEDDSVLTLQLADVLYLIDTVRVEDATAEEQQADIDTIIELMTMGDFTLSDGSVITLPDGWCLTGLTEVRAIITDGTDTAGLLVADVVEFVDDSTILLPSGAYLMIEDVEDLSIDVHTP